MIDCTSLTILHSFKNSGKALFDKDLLYPIKHRDQKAQLHLQSIKARDVLVATRTQIVNHVRSTVKVHGERISKYQASTFHNKAREDMPEILIALLEPVLAIIEDVNKKIKAYGRYIETVSIEEYPAHSDLEALEPHLTM